MEQIEHLLKAFAHESGYPLFFTGTLFFVFFTALYGLQMLAANLPKARMYILLAFSLFFYYHFSDYYFVILLASTALVDFLIGQNIRQAENRTTQRTLVGLSVTLNLGMLGYYKYANFFLDTVNQMGGSYEALEVALPIGISYYTFKTISYILDVYYEEIEEPESNYGRYLLYLTFFPNVLAGPITRATEFLTQTREKLFLSAEQLGRAFFLFFTGLFKKVVIADYLAANYVDRIFDAPESYTGFENLMATYAYGIQLFCDFSGYTSMALGIALLLGYELSPNFNEPFKARSISEFWRRWHISLSTWFNDYVFTPLNFSLRNWGKAGIMIAVIVTFALSGLWHGAGLTFILWGLSHGVVIAFESVTGKKRKRLRKQWNTKLYDGISWFLTFNYLSFTYVFFRSKDMESAGKMFGQIFANFAPQIIGKWFVEYQTVFWALALGMAMHFIPKSWKDAALAAFTRLHWALKAAACFIAAAFVIVVSRNIEAQEFVYLQF